MRWCEDNCNPQSMPGRQATAKPPLVPFEGIEKKWKKNPKWRRMGSTELIFTSDKHKTLGWDALMFGWDSSDSRRTGEPLAVPVKYSHGAGGRGNGKALFFNQIGYWCNRQSLSRISALHYPMRLQRAPTSLMGWVNQWIERHISLIHQFCNDHPRWATSGAIKLHQFVAFRMTKRLQWERGLDSKTFSSYHQQELTHIIGRGGPQVRCKNWAQGLLLSRKNF